MARNLLLPNIMRHEPVQSPGTSASDEELVALLRSGASDAAMDGIEKRYANRLFHFARGVVRDSHLAQDVVQEVLQKILLKNELYEPGTNFRAWIFEIARNQALSTLRKNRRVPRPMSALPLDNTANEHNLLESLETTAPDRSLEEREFMAAFEAAVAALPEHYRTVFDVCVRQGKPYRQAATQLGVPTGTVAIRIMRARKRLFGGLEQHLDRLRRPPACIQQGQPRRQCAATPPVFSPRSAIA
ncbi:MAG: sigma-70 family RNA polymerase sigma factor [Planctomycetota bacterium]|nr:sigma-70 family RNA polymerase sigma factor [Planctomycetota bacterium]